MLKEHIWWFFVCCKTKIFFINKFRTHKASGEYLWNDYRCSIAVLAVLLVPIGVWSLAVVKPTVDGVSNCLTLLFLFFNWTVWCQEVAQFHLGLCCAEEERGETPGREGSPTDLVESELDPGGDSKAVEDKAFGRTMWPDSKMDCFKQTTWLFIIRVM